MGAILYDNETRASWKLYRVTSIQFIRSYTVHRHSCWEATCEPVYRDGETGHFIVPADQRVPDSKILKTTALQGYALAEYREGLDNAPSDLPWVAQYIAHFRNVIMPRYSSLFSQEVLPIPYRIVIKPYLSYLSFSPYLVLQDSPSFEETTGSKPTPRRRKRPDQSSSVPKASRNKRSSSKNYE